MDKKGSINQNQFEYYDIFDDNDSEKEEEVVVNGKKIYTSDRITQKIPKKKKLRD